MSDPHDVQLGPQLIELPKSKLPAGLADESGAYPFFCSSQAPKAIGQWLVDGEAVVLGTGGVASVNFGRGKFAYSTDCWAIQARRGELSTEYLYRVLQQQLHRIDYAGFEGSGLRHLRKDFIRNLAVSVPGEDVQARVSEILAAVDDAIAQTEALIEKTRQIKAGLMHDLFTRGVTPDGQLRPPREQAPELYQESALGWIPKEWIFTSCSEVCDKIIDCKNRTPPETPDGFPVIRTPNVRDGEFVDEGLLYTDENSYLIWITRGKPQPGDIVITREAPVGEVCMIPKRHEFACLGQRMMLYRCNESKVDPKYFLYVLQCRQVQNRLDLISGGSTVGHVRVGDIRNLWIFMPSSHEEQKQISSSLDAVSERLREEGMQLEKLRATRLGVMHDLLAGRVALSMPETAAA